MKDAVESLQCVYLEIADRLSVVGPERFPISPQHDGSAHVEFEGAEFLYKVTERGETLESRSTNDAEELLFWLVTDLTWSMACEYELAHRIAGEDPRRQHFAKHVELLEAIDPRWGAVMRTRYAELVRNHPWNDG